MKAENLFFAKSTPLPKEYQHRNKDNDDNTRPAECVVSGALALVLRASRLVGAAPLEISDVGAGCRVTVSPTLAVYQQLFLTTLIMIALTGLVLDYLEDPDRQVRVDAPVITQLVWLFDRIMIMGIAGFVVYQGSSRMESFIRLLKRLQQINTDLNNNTYANAQKRGVLAVSCMLATLLAVQIGENYIHLQVLKEKGRNCWIYATYSTYYVAYTMGIMALLQWAFTAVLVHNAAATLNKRLLRLRHHDYCLPYNESKLIAYPSQVQSTLRRLALSYGDIGELMKQMNELNGTIIMGLLITKLLHLVVTPYYLLLSILSNEDLLGVILVDLCWAVVHTSTLLLIVEPCHWMQSERENTKFLLSRLIVQLAPKSKQIFQEIEQFAKHISLTSAEFAPLGIVTLGRPLLASTFGSVATYLVIIIQFHAISGQQ